MGRAKVLLPLDFFFFFFCSPSSLSRLPPPVWGPLVPCFEAQQENQSGKGAGLVWGFVFHSRGPRHDAEDAPVETAAGGRGSVLL